MEVNSLDILKQQFGYDSFRTGQAEIIDHVISGGDALVLMPTGAGKSLCFQIPAILREGTGIIISPLISLMRDQVQGLRENGIKAEYLNSSLSQQEDYNVREKIKAGEIDLLYVSPERLLTEEFQEFIKQIKIALFAIDEAHCVSQWGHDFRKEYRGLSILHENFPNVPRIALTATADEPTRREIIENLKLQQAKHFTGGFDRPNIEYHVSLKQNANSQLLNFIKSRQSGESGIIYCLSRKKTEQIAAFLKEKGFQAYPYHAGMDAAMRERNQDIFIKEEGIIIVGTIAFGMGIDKPNVRYVCHLDLPKSLEAYYQETGRAGRDGLPSTAWMIYGMGDLITMKQMIQSSESPEDRKKIEHRKLNSLLGFCETAECRRKVLLSYFGDNPPQTCNACDTCLIPVESWDGTKEAQMALSTVFRTGQRFGAAYLSDILLGADNPRIVNFRHDKLSVFGIGKSKNRIEWLSIFRQLIALGYLSSDLEGHGSLILTPPSREVLNGKQKVRFRTDVTLKMQGRKTKPARASTEPQTPANQALFEILRGKRLEIAKREKLPPYVIFHDKTLHEMARFRPVTNEELLRIQGIGESKLKKYGDEFLEVMRNH
jgi:ATP-dependent DNA helicase RecQ